MKLELSAVSRAFGTHKALDQLTLSVQSVQTLVLIGPSGGGKSTLLRVLAGLETPDSGQIVLNDCPLIFEEKALLQHRRSTGVVPKFQPFPALERFGKYHATSESCSEEEPR
jgi:polar amino acid transport system ATP-binding protein